MTEIKFCKDCKWAKKKWFQDWELARCYHPKNQYTREGLVSGKDKSLCYLERDWTLYGFCGREGKYFEKAKP